MLREGGGVTRAAASSAKTGAIVTRLADRVDRFLHGEIEGIACGAADIIDLEARDREPGDVDAALLWT